jgi:hypothetical protein
VVIAQIKAHREQLTALRDVVQRVSDEDQSKPNASNPPHLKVVIKHEIINKKNGKARDVDA